MTMANSIISYFFSANHLPSKWQMGAFWRNLEISFDALQSNDVRRQTIHNFGTLKFRNGINDLEQVQVKSM